MSDVSFIDQTKEDVAVLDEFKKELAKNRKILREDNKAVKEPLNLIPPATLLQVAMAFKAGSDEYGVNNWVNEEMPMSVYYSSLSRHLIYWASGKNVDDKSSVHHMAHVAANALIILHLDSLGLLIDDRIKSNMD